MIYLGSYSVEYVTTMGPAVFTADDFQNTQKISSQILRPCVDI